MVDILIGLFIATLITELFSTRIYKLIWWYALNSLILGSIATYIGFSKMDTEMIITGILTMFIKFLIIPYILKYFIIKHKIKRQIISSIKIHYSVIIIPMVLVFTFYLITPILENFEVNSNYIAIATAGMFLSLLLINEFNNLIAKIIGFLSIENSLFLLGISATDGMPMLIELGIFFDLLMLIIVINLLFKNQGELL